jgi:hypothetical protein
MYSSNYVGVAVILDLVSFWYSMPGADLFELFFIYSHVKPFVMKIYENEKVCQTWTWAAPFGGSGWSVGFTSP